MTQLRKAGAGRGRSGSPTPAPSSGRPFTARSVVASTLLGVEPPRLPTRLLVRSGELFGISPGTTRVAISRMVAAGELVVDGDAHRLAGRLLERQARQQASRSPRRRRWGGEWILAVVTETRRPVAARAELRAAMSVLRRAEWREGVWLRPDNLDESWAGPAQAVVAAQCHQFVGRPESFDGSADAGFAGAPADHLDPTSATGRPDDPSAELAARLWDLDAWAGRAVELRGQVGHLARRLDDGDTAALAPAFVLSADVLRHLLADPLLPPELLAPDWPGDGLRSDYDRYDQAFKRLWRDWFRQEAAP